MFHLCYLDESGCLGALPSAASRIQPIFSIAGLIIPADRLPQITRDFIALKQRFHPGLFSKDDHNLDGIRREIKGETLRRGLKIGGHNRRRAVLGFLNHALKLLEESDSRLVGRVWIKPVGEEFKGREIYTFSAQAVAENFQRFLAAGNSRGMIVCDSREPRANAIVSHSVFTRKFKWTGDPFPRLLDSPVFADSGNHAGIQMADLLCSAIVSPLAAAVYHSGSPHAHPNYLHLHQRFGERLNKLQFRFKDDDGKLRGGIVVSDPDKRRSGRILFHAPDGR